MRLAPGQPKILTKVKDMAERLGLAMIGAWPTLGLDGHLVPEAFTVNGTSVGRLLLPEHPYGFSVSLDGGWVAWVPFGSVSLTAPEPLVRFTDNPGSVKDVRFKGLCGNQVAISSKAERIALIAVVDAAGSRRLVVLNPATAEAQYDLTDLVDRVDLAQTHRFQISADGDRLAVASRQSFAVIDVASHKVLLTGDERFPSLSHRGDALAFLNKRGDIVIKMLGTGVSKTIANAWWTTVGIGGWSPDGRFLLAGVRDPVGFSTNLVAIDCLTGEYAEIMHLEVEGDHGAACAWIKRSLLSR
jgi:hypothetical protein